jgi:hypothetical protein
MSNVQKINNGLILYDTFQNLNNWETFPDNSFFDTTNGLTIHHSDELLRLLRNIPVECVIEVFNDYNPTTTGVEGGLIVIQDEEKKIEFLEYYDGTVWAYPYLKIIRFHNIYSFYSAQEYGNWQFEGICEGAFESPKAGFCLYDNVNDYHADYIKIYKNNNIIVDNVAPGVTVKLVNEMGYVLQERICPIDKSSVTFVYDTFPIMGHFVFVKDGNVLDADYDMEIWGGDEYRFDIGLDVLYNNEPLPTIGTTFVGALQIDANNNRQLLTSITLHNAYANYAFQNVRVSIAQYGNDEHYRLVDISLDGINFQKTLVIPTLTTDQIVYVKIVDDPFMRDAQAYFDIKVVFEV